MQPPPYGAPAGTEKPLVDHRAAQHDGRRLGALGQGRQCEQQPHRPGPVTGLSRRHLAQGKPDGQNGGGPERIEHVRSGVVPVFEGRERCHAHQPGQQPDTRLEQARAHPGREQRNTHQSEHGWRACQGRADLRLPGHGAGARHQPVAQRRLGQPIFAVEPWHQPVAAFEHVLGGLGHIDFMAFQRDIAHAAPGGRQSQQHNEDNRCQTLIARS